MAKNNKYNKGTQGSKRQHGASSQDYLAVLGMIKETLPVDVPPQQAAGGNQVEKLEKPTKLESGNAATEEKKGAAASQGSGLAAAAGECVKDSSAVDSTVSLPPNLASWLCDGEIAEGNLHHMFFVDYYEGLRNVILGGTDQQMLDATAALNREFYSFQFKKDFQIQPLDGFDSFELKTTYPGLLAGTGLSHGAGVKGEIAIGFTFDYVTGLPYIPGSTVKGVIRSGFRLGNYEFVKELSASLNNMPQGALRVLEEDIFEQETGGDVFFDAYPALGGDGRNRLLVADNLAPAERTKTPIIISFLRIKPGVKFRFIFKLTDSNVTFEDNGETRWFAFTKEEKRKLFLELICTLGIGAKTNVGYGRLEKCG